MTGPGVTARDKRIIAIALCPRAAAELLLERDVECFDVYVRNAVLSGKTHAQAAAEHYSKLKVSR